MVRYFITDVRTFSSEYKTVQCSLSAAGHRALECNVAISAMKRTYTWRSARGVCKDTRGADRAHHKTTATTHVASILSVLHVPCAVTLSVRIPVQVSVHWELFFICAVCHFGCGCQSPFSSTAKCLASGLQCRLSFRYSHYDSCRMQKKQHQTSIHRALWSSRALSVFW